MQSSGKRENGNTVDSGKAGRQTLATAVIKKDKGNEVFL